jgi:chromosome segregation ATPase
MPTQDRSKLKDAIDALKLEQASLAELTAAAERSMEKSWTFGPKIEDAAKSLARAVEGEDRRLALAYAGEVDEAGSPSPVPQAREHLRSLQDEAARLAKIRAALDAEIADTERNLKTLQANLYKEAAAVVTSSDSYIGLLQDQKDLWRRLRTAREAFKVIHAALHSSVPDAALIAERLELRVGYSINQSVIDAWSEALEELLKDPENAELPST